MGFGESEKVEELELNNVFYFLFVVTQFVEIIDEGKKSHLIYFLRRP